MRQPPSIFNDVIGPVMVGPSSSHTAAGVRIGYFIRALAGGAPERVTFFFSRQGSLADCHELQGSDMGLAAGILGLPLEDPRVGDSMLLARQAGISIDFQITDEAVAHPNTYRFAVAGGGREHSGEAVSLGGGMIELRVLDGFPVSIGGGYCETILYCGVIAPERAQEYAGLLRETGVYDEVAVASNALGEYLLDARTGSDIQPDALREIPALERIVFPKVLPVGARRTYDGLFNTVAEIKEISQREGKALWEIAVQYETLRGGLRAEEVLDRMDRLVSVMEATLERTARAPKAFPNRILGPQAHLLDRAEKGLPDPLLNAVIRNITLFMEAKSSLEVVVAAPTSGACAALPGALLGAAQYLKLERRQVVKAMLAAGMIGILLVEHATIAGEVGGCQAECGSASGMAAAGLVQLLDGSAEQALKAASMALQNVFGLVCDPVAERVEVPCLGRNILAGANAVAMANLALAGFQEVIPLDETIDAMYQVGLRIDPALRCTCQAGLSATPTSRAIAEKMSAGKSDNVV